MKKEALIQKILDELTLRVQLIADMAIPLCKMEQKVRGNNVFLGVALVPEAATQPVLVTAVHVLPPAGSLHFPFRMGGAPFEHDKNYRRIFEKGPRLAYQYLSRGDLSAFDSRVELRGLFDGKEAAEWEGAFIITFEGHTFVVILSGPTGKLSEAVLLVACEDAGFLTPEQARAYSRPRIPGQKNTPRRNFDYFYEPVQAAWKRFEEEYAIEQAVRQQEAEAAI